MYMQFYILCPFLLSPHWDNYLWISYLLEVSELRQKEYRHSDRVKEPAWNKYQTVQPHSTHFYLDLKFCLLIPSYSSKFLLLFPFYVQFLLSIFPCWLFGCLYPCHTPTPHHPYFFLRTPNFNNLLFLLDPPLLLTILLGRKPCGSTGTHLLANPLIHPLWIQLVDQAFHWPQVWDNNNSEGKGPDTAQYDTDSFSPLENIFETDLQFAFSNISLLKTGFLHVDPPFCATLTELTPPYFPTALRPVPTYFGRTSDSLAFRETINRAIQEYEDTVSILVEVLTLKIAIFRRVKCDFLQRMITRFGEVRNLMSHQFSMTMPVHHHVQK